VQIVTDAEARRLLATKKTSKKRNEFGLTEQAECFCTLIAESVDISGAEAYRMAYPNWQGKDSTLYPVVSRMMKDPKIVDRIETLRNAVVSRCPLTKGEALQQAADLARGCHDKGDVAGWRGAIQTIQGLIPGWTAQDSGSDDDAPERIEITIVTEQRERPVRVLEVLPPDEGDGT
jgi:hypothetical protein